MDTSIEPVNQPWPMLEHNDVDQGDMQQQLHQQQDIKRARKKLRDSCNSCALSKVKCSRDRPSCERCEDRGIYCRYSPSRRTGKRRVTNPIQPASGSQTQLASLGQITPTLSEGSCAYDFDFFDFDNGNEKAVSNAITRSIPDTHDSLKASTHGDPLMGWDDPLFAVILDDLENDSSDAFDYSSLMAQNDNKTIQDPSRLENAYPTSASKSSDGSAFSEISQAETNEKMVEASSLESLKSLFHILGQGSNTPSASNKSCPGASAGNTTPSGTPRDCMSIALNALQSLHRPHPACTMASEGDSTKTQTLEIDHVLATNKEIIDSIATILKCSCSLDTQLALILTVIGFKIIAWYSAVARSDEEQDGNPLACSTTRSSKPTAERVSHMPIKVGNYNLDGVDKARMRAQMALSELQRVVRLIEQLGKSFGQVGRDTEMDGMDISEEVSREPSAREPQTSPTTIGVVLMTFLHDRVRSATNETMSILKDSLQ